MPEQTNIKFRPKIESAAPAAPSLISYAELSVTSNFSFLRGASHPEELIAQAAHTACRAIALTDINTLAGIVRAHEAAKENTTIRFLVGCHLAFNASEECPIKNQKSKIKNFPADSQILPFDSPPQLPLSLLIYPTNRSAYGRLCRLLTRGKRRAAKGHCDFSLHDLREFQEDQLAILIPPPPPLITDDFLATAKILRETFDKDRLSLAACCLYHGEDAAHLKKLADLARDLEIPLVATNDVHYHTPERRPLQDVLTCIRLGCTLDQAGFALFANAERHIKGPEEMARLFRDFPEAIARTMQIADRIAFSLNELKYEYPSEVCPAGKTMMEHLIDRTWAGARERYAAEKLNGLIELNKLNEESSTSINSINLINPINPINSPSCPDHPSNAHIPTTIKARLAHEFQLIKDLNYPAYFLTVDDIVAFARSKNILCQGRGAAANSAVCYCLGITAVDPAHIDLLVERFMSKERDEPPDIDIDFEHERREEVIQYIYTKYGRDRAALTAEVISYRRRSAVRDVGKAMGLSLDCVDRLAKSGDWWESEVITESRLRELGFDPHDRTLRQTIALAGELIGFPRHLSQHVGGFVISRGPLCEIVPIENAAMPDRTIIEWDKDDIDAMGMLKVDVLGLGMLTCIRKAIDFVNASTHKEIEPQRTQRAQRDDDEATSLRPSSSVLSVSSVVIKSPAPRLQFHTVPPEDPRVYDMLCNADSIGVFQVESRAQMTMLPRLRPRCYYDLVIEVAIVRPGPIQGDMVHPYLRRRNATEPITYPNDAIKKVLERTLGVPLFQEQAMRLVMVAASFTAGEADQLRRAMAAWKKKGHIMEKFAAKIVTGMLANGYSRPYADRVVKQIKGFSDYGFPESHAASFALLVYVSAWLKCHHPAAFAAALINSQPMGFYQPAQIVRDAKDHGVEVLPVDINFSTWDCTLEGKKLNELIGLNKLIEAPHPSQLTPLTHLTQLTSSPSLRLGTRLVTSLRQIEADRIAAAVKTHGPFHSIVSLWRKSGVRADTLRKLAAADAFTSMGLDRQAALWATQQLRDDSLPMFDGMDPEEPAAELPSIPLRARVVYDYAATGLSLKAHPVSFARAALNAIGVTPAGHLADEKLCPHGRRLSVAGLVLVRQRPGTASGILFMTLEDETGIANLVVRPNIYDQHRAALRHSIGIIAHGKVERQGQVVHLLIHAAEPLTTRMPDVETTSRDFH